ncbi:unnamed protein product [Schistosoma bovis]|nr:unnamed protein product [Schistosoma bovis]
MNWMGNDAIKCGQYYHDGRSCDVGNTFLYSTHCCKDPSDKPACCKQFRWWPLAVTICASVLVLIIILVCSCCYNVFSCLLDILCCCRR